jgi:hypothetical protein
VEDHARARRRCGGGPRIAGHHRGAGGPRHRRPGGLAFPVTGGKANAKSFEGSITHSGRVRLSRGETVVDLTSFTINVDFEPDLSALVGGQWVSIGGVKASLTAAAADALNGAFATDAFKEGLVLGTVTVVANAR